MGGVLMRRIQDWAAKVWKWKGYLGPKKGLCPFLPAGFLAAVLLCGGAVLGFAQGTAKGSPYKYYTSIPIEKGDTLWSIAKEYMTEDYDGIEEYIREIRRVNHLSGDKIDAGRYLAIPRCSSE